MNLSARLRRMKVGRVIQTLANLAIIVITAVTLPLLVKQYRSRSEPPRVEEMAARPLDRQLRSPKGKKIALEGIDWSGHDHTIVLAMRSDCKFCTESGPFYKTLVAKQASQSKVGLVAVLPDDVESSRRYLNSLGVSVADVKKAELDSLGVPGTPTILFVDSTGLVTDAWIGRLTPITEAEVLRQL